MLLNLRTKNFGILKSVDIDFEPGLVVLTGESGAGKSSTLRALMAPWESSKNNADGWVESTYQQNSNEESTFGRNWRGARSFPTIDGMKTKADIMPELPFVLVRQGASAWLRNDSTARTILDGQISSNVLSEYQVQWSSYCQLRQEYTTHLEKLNSLNKAGLDKTVTDLEPYFSNAPEIKSEIEKELKSLKIAYEQSSETLSILSSLGEGGTFLDNIQSWANKTNDSELSQAYEILANKYDQLIATPLVHEEELNAPQEQLYLLDQLEYQYGNIHGWHTVYTEAIENIRIIESGEALTKEIKVKLLQAKQEVMSISEKLTKARKQAALPLAKKINKILSDLGISGAQFTCRIDKQDRPNQHGIDKIEFLWDPNQTGLVNIGKGASGGELSRIMLAFQSVIPQNNSQTYIYDEIDSGLSGKSLVSVGKYLKKQVKMGSQVIIITHSPAIAAMADQHILLEKVKGDTSLKSLSYEERKTALLTMLGASEDMSDSDKDNLMKVLKNPIQ